MITFTKLKEMYRISLLSFAWHQRMEKDQKSSQERLRIVSLEIFSKTFHSSASFPSLKPLSGSRKGSVKKIPFIIKETQQTRILVAGSQQGRQETGVLPETLQASSESLKVTNTDKLWVPALILCSHMQGPCRTNNFPHCGGGNLNKQKVSVELLLAIAYSCPQSNPTNYPQCAVSACGTYRSLLTVSRKP